ncbi:MAG: transcriptional repressor LexA [Kiritimatiellales bacterium]|nr:transcriptional repressor LexA [Kiritimatiellales bacterium]
MKELTARQAEIHDFMVCWQRDNGFPPSQEEIRDHFGFASPNAVRSHLALIAKKGLICLNAGKARGIQLKTSTLSEMGSSDKSIPIVGTIAAGEPILAEQNIENLLPIPRALFGGGELFALHVKGDSMVQAGILNGDVAIIRKQSHVENGEIGAVLLGQDATLKRVFLTSGSLRLKAENPTCDDLVYNESSIESPRVIGRYQGIVRTSGLGSVL